MGLCEGLGRSKLDSRVRDEWDGAHQLGRKRRSVRPGVGLVGPGGSWLWDRNCTRVLGAPCWSAGAGERDGARRWDEWGENQRRASAPAHWARVESDTAERMEPRRIYGRVGGADVLSCEAVTESIMYRLRA